MSLHTGHNLCSVCNKLYFVMSSESVCQSCQIMKNVYQSYQNAFDRAMETKNCHRKNESSTNVSRNYTERNMEQLIEKRTEFDKNGIVQNQSTCNKNTCTCTCTCCIENLSHSSLSDTKPKVALVDQNVAYTSAQGLPLMNDIGGLLESNNNNNIQLSAHRSNSNPYLPENTISGYSRIKKHECEFCNKLFRNLAFLKIHLRSHTGERPYVCQICNQAFSQSSSLRTHEKLKHSDEKPYKCSLCDKEFATQNYLTVHYRTHTKEKPYGCPVCGKHFTQKSSVGTHMKMH